MPAKRPKSAVPISTGPGYFIRQATRVIHDALGRELAEEGIALSHYPYLRALFEQDGITQIEISERTGKEPATTTAMLDTLEKKGYVRRERQTADRRKIDVFLTAEGKKLKRPILRVLARLNEHALEGISALEYRRWQETLLKIAANVAAYDAGDEPPAPKRR